MYKNHITKELKEKNSKNRTNNRRVLSLSKIKPKIKGYCLIGAILLTLYLASFGLYTITKPLIVKSYAITVQWILTEWDRSECFTMTENAIIYGIPATEESLNRCKVLLE